VSRRTFCSTLWGNSRCTQAATVHYRHDGPADRHPNGSRERHAHYAEPPALPENSQSASGRLLGQRSYPEGTTTHHHAGPPALSWVYPVGLPCAVSAQLPESRRQIAGGVISDSATHERREYRHAGNDPAPPLCCRRASRWPLFWHRAGGGIRSSFTQVHSRRRKPWPIYLIPATATNRSGRSARGIVKLMDHEPTVPQYIVIMTSKLSQNSQNLQFSP